jgi:hypothetical protein
MIVEKQMECRLAGDTEVLGENLPQRHFTFTFTFFWYDTGRIENNASKNSSLAQEPLGTARRRWVDNTEMDLREIGMGWYGLDRSGSG